MNRLPPLVLLAALTACGDASTDIAHTVRDSAGIRIVESTAPAWKEGQEWTVAAEPLLDIGEVDGEAPYQLDRVAGVRRLADGRIVVANGGSQELRWFGADGRFLRASGGEGGGPGEFRSIGWIGVGRGDSLLVLDGRERRVSVFAPDGAFVRSVQPEGLRMYPQGVGMLADGSLVLTEGIDFAAQASVPEGENRDSVTYLRLAADGSVARLGRFAGPEQFLVRVDGNSMNGRVVFGRDVFVSAAGEGLLVGDNDRYEIARRADDGRTAMLIRRRHEPVTVGPDDVARLYAEEDARAGSSASGPMAAMLEQMKRQERERTPHRSTLPAFRELLSDNEGNLWVRQYPRPGDPPRWDVFAPEGRWLGTVQTPEGLDIHQIGADWIVGVARDEMDVQHVRLHRIVKPAAS